MAEEAVYEQFCRGLWYAWINLRKLLSTHSPRGRHSLLVPSMILKIQYHWQCRFLCRYTE